jgi:hypothetical protein
MIRRPKHRRRARVPGWLVLASVALGILSIPGPAKVLTLTPAPRPAFVADISRPARPVSALAGKKAPPHPTRQVADRGRTGQWTSGGVVSSKGRYRIVIPRIGVDAPVIDLNLNSDGSLEVPSDYRVAGWYAGGPEPGDVGPSVIVGHVDSKSGPGVFYRLRDLQPGDVIQVWRAGKKLKFVVQSLDEFSKSNFPTTKVYGRVDVPALRIITCGGVFNYITHHYEDNVVVFAKMA